MVQTERGADMLVVTKNDVQSLVPDLMSVRISAVETLGRNQASGKLKRFVPLPPR